MTHRSETLKLHARDLRAEATDAERLMWHHLRGRRMAGAKFRRQHPVGGFIADFACLESGLIVELDGGQHYTPEAQAADTRRTEHLQEAGYTVLRFHNGQILAETEAVLSAIHAWLAARQPSASPQPLPAESAQLR